MQVSGSFLVGCFCRAVLKGFWSQSTQFGTPRAGSAKVEQFAQPDQSRQGTLGVSSSAPACLIECEMKPRKRWVADARQRLIAGKSSPTRRKGQRPRSADRF